jgi:molybdate transport system ATP-binding protein
VSGPILDAQLGVSIGDFHLDAGLSLAAGEVVAILGPNGSGKTTALRLLSGLLGLERGRIVVDGEALDDPAAHVFVPAERRAVSILFQDYLLFPHLSAVENVAFGIRARGVGAAEARQRANAWLDRLGLADKAGVRPRQLSGGQAQRVALARSLATDPRVLLLDEPLAALDVGTRATVRRDLRRFLDEFTGGTLLVTHDPLDAIALASRIVILEHGVVTQTGSIDDITTRPTSRYVADLIGLNLLRGTADGRRITLDGGQAEVELAEPASGAVFALIHPNAVALFPDEPAGSPRNQWAGTVTGFDLLGDRVRVRVSGVVPLVAEVTPAAVAALDLHEGQAVWTVVKATEVEAYSA